MAVNLPLQPIDAYKSPDWFFSDDPALVSSPLGGRECGYYIHQNRLYLAGLVANATNIGGTYNTVTTTILSGLPPDLSPAADTAITLYAMLDALENPGPPVAPIPITLPAHISAAGTLSLDSLPPYINDIPGGTQLSQNTALSGTEPDFVYPALYPLLLGNVSWLIDVTEADEPFWTDLGPYIAAGDDFDYFDAQYALHNSRIHLRGTVRAKRTTASDLADGIPAAMVAAITPTKSAITNIAGPAFGPQLAVFHETPRLTTIGDTRAGVPLQPPLRWFDPSTARLAFNVLFTYSQPPGSFMAGLFIPQTHGDIPPSDWGTPVDIGRRQTVVTTIASQTIVGVRYDCPGDPGAGKVANSFAIANSTYDAQVASFDPAPDWVSVLATWEGGGGFSFDAATHDCPPAFLGGTATLASSVAGTDFVDGTGTPTGSWSAPPATVVGWDNSPAVLHRDDGGIYDKDPYNRGKELLFRPDELAGLEIDLDAGPVWEGTASLTILVIPFYELRTDWIVAGDVIDLAGAGWHADYTDPPLMTTIAAGPGLSGIVPLSALA